MTAGRMTPERWARISEIFGEAMERSADQRTAYLEEACGNDAELRFQVLELLETHERGPAFVDQAAPGAQELRAAAMRAAGVEGSYTASGAGSGWRERAFHDGELVNARFRITRFLGEGGMGEVYAAEDTELRTWVAIKTLHPHLAVSDKFAERFRREIQIARQITHSNVCRTFDAGRHNQILFFTMELLDGETLAQHIERKGRMTPAAATPLIRQLCGGLGSAHKAGVVHRDFKAANIILIEDRAVITDFGLSRLMESEADGTAAASTGLAIGTPAYMSPEQIEGQPASAASDIYALGVVMYEMITGQRPYPETSALALAAKKTKEPPRPPRDLVEVPPAWESVILKCLAIRPQDRFANANDVIAALESGRKVRLAKPPLLKQPRFAIIVATAALAIIGVLGIRAFVLRAARHVPPAEAVRWYRDGETAMAQGAWLKASRLLAQAIKIDDRYVSAHARLGEVYAELDQGDLAKDEVIHAASLAPDRSRLPREEGHLLDAAEAMVARDFDAAQSAYQAIAAEAPADQKGRAELDLGRAAEKASHNDAAIAAYQAARESAAEREPALLHLGTLTLQKGQPENAIAFLNESERLFRLSSNLEGATEAVMARGRVYEQTKRLDGAEAEMRKAVELAESTGNEQQQVKSRFELGRIQLREGHADEARRTAQDALELAAAAHVENLTVAGLNDLGGIFATEAQWKEAEDYFERALELAKRTKTRQGEARAQLMLGQAHLEKNDADGALPLVEQAVRFFREGRYSSQLYGALTVLCDVQARQGKYREANANAEELQRLGRERQQPQVLLWGLQRGATSMMSLGDFPAELKLSEQSAALEHATGRALDEAYSLLYQAEALAMLGRYAEFERRFEQAGVILKKLGESGNAAVEFAALTEGEVRLTELRNADAQRAVAPVVRNGGSTLLVLEARQVECLALVRQGKIQAGEAECSAAAKGAVASQDPYLIAATKVALAETALRGGAEDAAALAAGARSYCLRFGLRDQALRASLILLEGQERAGKRAAVEELRAALTKDAEELKRAWGAEAAALYFKRPDLQNFARAAAGAKIF